MSSLNLLKSKVTDANQKMIMNYKNKLLTEYLEKQTHQIQLNECDKETRCIESSFSSSDSDSSINSPPASPEPLPPSPPLLTYD